MVSVKSERSLHLIRPIVNLVKTLPNNFVTSMFLLQTEVEQYLILFWGRWTMQYQILFMRLNVFLSCPYLSKKKHPNCYTFNTVNLLQIYLSVILTVCLHYSHSNQHYILHCINCFVVNLRSKLWKMYTFCTILFSMWNGF